jgi:hypothetical protein
METGISPTQSSLTATRPRQPFERHRRQLHQSGLEVVPESDWTALDWLASRYGIHHIRIFGLQLSGERHCRATAQYHPRLPGWSRRARATPQVARACSLWSSGLTTRQLASRAATLPSWHTALSRFFRQPKSSFRFGPTVRMPVREHDRGPQLQTGCPRPRAQRRCRLGAGTQDKAKILDRVPRR